MEEKLPLVDHGVTRDELMKCRDVTKSMKELPAEMDGSESFSESAVASDLVQIEQHLFAELPVLLRVKETLSDIL